MDIYSISERQTLHYRPGPKTMFTTTLWEVFIYKIIGHFDHLKNLKFSFNCLYKIAILYILKMLAVKWPVFKGKFVSIYSSLYVYVSPRI
jgi:hypothetical protein